ncbi:hypothetical protein FB446DRAFT_708599 [Lentinula raphanica]|nr:hypothetical protein FB446DRAFT_708599 [Lentinula raphanica]
MPSTAPTYNENPTFAGPLPRGFSGTEYGKALVGLRLTFDQKNDTEYLKDLGKCLNPRTPGKVHHYSVLTGGQGATRDEMGRITRHYCGTKECRNPDKIWGPPGKFQHISVPAGDRLELAEQYVFWLESMGKTTQAENIQNHFLEGRDTRRQVNSSPVRPRTPHDLREVQSSPIPIRPRVPRLEPFPITSGKRKADSEHLTTGSKVPRLSKADGKRPRRVLISSDSESEVEIVSVSFRNAPSIPNHTTTSAGPSGVHQPSGSRIRTEKSCIFTSVDLIQACKQLEQRAMEVIVEENLKAALESLKETLDVFV